MAFELSKDLTYFAETMDNLQSGEAAQNTDEKRSTNKRKTRNSLQKENGTEIKKTNRESRKSNREPLKVLNTKIKTPKKSVSPSTALPAKAQPTGRKTPAKHNVFPSQLKTGKKEKLTVPKIIVYKDPSDKTKVQEKGNKQKNGRGLSKSWNDSVTTTRRSYSGSEKSPKLVVSKTKNVRRSLNDLTSVKSPSKKVKSPKNVAEDKKSPAKPKLKPGQPEFEEMLTKLETLFPNVDPEFLKAQFIKLKGSLSEIIEFLISKEKTNEVPTRAGYVRRLEMERLQNKFMEDFSVVNYLKMIPDPWEHFLKTEKHNSVSYLGHSLHYLKTKYKKHYLQSIQEALAKNEYSLYLADKELKRKSRVLKMRATNRSKYECDAGRPTNFNIQFIHEVAFIENESKIKSHIKKAETTRYKKFKQAEKAGTLLECQSCNDFSLLQDDVVNCPANHVFCKDCLLKYVEIEMGKDNFQFKCLLKCEEKFSLKILQDVLSPPVMAKIIQRNQLEEIKSAGINDLVYCPFCYYVIIMPPELSIFKCLNPSCMMESCRHCKKLNHVPLKCNELEKVDETALVEIVEIEDEKVSSLKCSNCSGEFLKREDSNQMVCPCGATICSICRQPFRECQHFNAEPLNESAHRVSLSFSDDDVDDDVDDGGDTETDEATAEDDVDGSTNCSENLLQMFLSESENF